MRALVQLGEEKEGMDLIGSDFFQEICKLNCKCNLREDCTLHYSESKVSHTTVAHIFISCQIRVPSLLETAGGRAGGPGARGSRPRGATSCRGDLRPRSQNFAQ